MEFSSSSSVEPSECETRKLLNSAKARSGALPQQVFVDAAREFGRAKLAVINLGIKLTPEDARSLDVITEEARVGFAAYVGSGHHR